MSSSAAVVSGYLALWAARAASHPARAMAVLLVATGVGATLGPYLARLPVARNGYVGAARILLASRVALLCGTGAVSASLGGSATAVLAAAVPLLLCLAAATTASVVVQATSRQTQYDGHLLAQMVGWAHSAAAAGRLVGTWVGLVLGVARSPLAGLLVAASVSLLAMRAVGEGGRTGTLAAS